jgi:hypothetical protein
MTEANGRITISLYLAKLDSRARADGNEASCSGQQCRKPTRGKSNLEKY